MFLIKKGLFSKALNNYSLLYSKASNSFCNKLDTSNSLALLFNVFKSRWSFEKKVVQNTNNSILRGTVKEKQMILFALSFFKKNVRKFNFEGASLGYLFRLPGHAVSLLQNKTYLMRKLSDFYIGIAAENLKTQAFALVSAKKRPKKIRW